MPPAPKLRALPRRLYRSCLARPVVTLVAVAAIAAATATGLPRLELRTDGRALAPADAPEVLHDERIRRQMGLRDPLVVVLTTDHPDGVFNPRTLRRVVEITRRLGELPEVEEADLLSLATELGLRRQDGALLPAPLLEPLPTTAEELARLRSDVQRIGLYERVLVSRDRRSTAVMVGLPSGGDRLDLYRRVRQAADADTPSGDPRVVVVGAAAAEVLLGRHILADLGLPAAVAGTDRPGLGMVPVALVVMFSIFLLGFRRPLAALLPLTEVATCLVVVFGVMGWCGVPVYLTIVVLPVILTAVGVADEIHLFRAYARKLAAEPGAARDLRQRRRLIATAFDEMAPPVLRTSATTAAGFLSFAVSPLAPVAAFGLFTALGVLLCLLFSLTAVPALLVLLPPAWLLPRSPGRWAAVGPSLLAALGRRLVRHRRAVLAAAALAAVVALDGVRRVKVEDSWLDGFDEQSALARATRHFDEQFVGAHSLVLSVSGEVVRWSGEIGAGQLDDLEVRLPAPAPAPLPLLAGSWLTVRTPERRSGGRLPPRHWQTWVDQITPAAGGELLTATLPPRGGSPRFWIKPRPGERLSFELHRQPLMQPEVIARLDELETFLADRPEVGGAFGPARYLRTTDFIVAPESSAGGRLPQTPTDSRRLWSYYALARGAERLRHVVDEEMANGLVFTFLPAASHTSVSRLLAAISELEARRLAPLGLAVGLAGDVAVSQALIDGVITTQLRSLGLSLLAIVAVVALLEAGGGRRRRLASGLLAALPPAFAVLASFALMGWLSIPLGVATSMFAGMTLGVGIDYSIHLLAAHRRAREAGRSGAVAVGEALSLAGPPILLDAAGVGLGFSVLLLSQVPANARLGGLLALAVFLCLTATLFLLPALLERRSAAAG